VLLDLGSFLQPREGLMWREIHWPAELPPEIAVALLRQLKADHVVRAVAVETEARGARSRNRGVSNGSNRPAFAGPSYDGRYWARTSDPQLVDSERPFGPVR
jgi:hypothetical protein